MNTQANTTKSTRGHSLAKSAAPIVDAALKAPRAKKADKPEAKPTVVEVVTQSTTDTPVIRKTIVPGKYKAQYAAHNGGCGDDMHLELTAATTTKDAETGRTVLDWPALQAIAEQNGLDVAKYAGLNNGQKRMNVGNRMRGLLKAGKDVKIGKRTFKAEDAKAAGDK